MDDPAHGALVALWQAQWSSSPTLRAKARLLPACPDKALAIEAAAWIEQAEQRKAERKAQRKVTKPQRHRGRIQRQRGNDAERLVAEALTRAGCEAWRVPLSGQLGGSRYSGDVQTKHPLVERIEVKRRQGAMKGFRGWLAQGNADAVVVVPGGGDAPLVFLTLERFGMLLGKVE